MNQQVGRRKQPFTQFVVRC